LSLHLIIEPGGHTDIHALLSWAEKQTMGFLPEILVFTEQPMPEKHLLCCYGIPMFLSMLLEEMKKHATIIFITLTSPYHLLLY